MSDIGDSMGVPWREGEREDDQKCKLASVPVEEIRSGGQRQSFKVQWYSAVGTLIARQCIFCRSKVIGKGSSFHFRKNGL